MTRGYTSAQIRAAEAPHLAAGEPLMRRAAHGLAVRILELLAARDDVHEPPRVLALAGSGDNGGDALFAAAELAQNGCAVHVIATGSRMHEAGLRAVRAAAGDSALPVPGEHPAAAAVRLLGDGIDVVVDGILGIAPLDRAGRSPALRGSAREVVAALLAGPALPPVVAVDVPSGIDADTGEVPDAAVLPATLTVTFGGVKAGLLRGDGARLAGEITLVRIGIDRELEATEPAIRLP